MMTYVQYLLCKVAEECNEVAQRAIKAQRFGLDETQEGQPLNNAERLVDEYLDLKAAMEFLEETGAIEIPSSEVLRARVREKRKRFVKYLQYSRERGMVQPL